MTESLIGVLIFIAVVGAFSLYVAHMGKPKK